MDYHQTVFKITDLLSQNGCWFETFEHEPVRTSEESARVRTGYSLKQAAKAMIIRVKLSESEKRFAMLVFPADWRFDNEKVRNLFGAKDIRLATEEEVSQLTGGVQAGGVPPFGNLFGLEVVTDPKLFENEKIIFNAGDRRFSVAIKSEDFRRLVSPREASIV